MSIIVGICAWTVVAVTTCILVAAAISRLKKTPPQ